MAAQKWSWSEARDPWGRARPQGRAALQTKQTRGRAGRLPFLWASQGQSGRKMHTSNYFRNVPCLRATVRGCAAAGRVSRADGGPEAPLGGLPGGCRHRAPCQHRTSPQGHRDGSGGCCSQARKGTARVKPAKRVLLALASLTSETGTFLLELEGASAATSLVSGTAQRFRHRGPGFRICVRALTQSCGARLSLGNLTPSASQLSPPPPLQLRRERFCESHMSSAHGALSSAFLALGASAFCAQAAPPPWL